jgi:hypothetical protein
MFDNLREYCQSRHRYINQIDINHMGINHMRINHIANL